MRLEDFKVGDKYVIKEIGAYSQPMFSLHGMRLNKNYKAGDVVEVVVDYVEDLCFSISPNDDCSQSLDSMITWGDCILEPYIEPAEVQKDDGYTICYGVNKSINPAFWTQDEHDLFNHLCESCGITNPYMHKDSVPQPPESGLRMARNYFEQWITMKMYLKSDFMRFKDLFKANISCFEDGIGWVEQSILYSIISSLGLSESDEIAVDIVCEGLEKELFDWTLDELVKENVIKLPETEEV